jgi:hypothetical protein
MKLFSITIYLIAILGLLGCSDPPPQKIEHLSIEGFVRAVEINRCPNWFGHDIIAVGFEDGRVKFFYGGIPDMVKQGANNKIFYERIHHGDARFTDKIEGITSYPEPKEPK